QDRLHADGASRRRHPGQAAGPRRLRPGEGEAVLIEDRGGPAALRPDRGRTAARILEVGFGPFVCVQGGPPREALLAWSDPRASRSKPARLRQRAFVMEITQQDRHLVLETPLGEDKLVLTALSGSEHVNGLFEFHLEAMSPEQNIDPKQLLGKAVTFSV